MTTFIHMRKKGAIIARSWLSKKPGWLGNVPSRPTGSKYLRQLICINFLLVFSLIVTDAWGRQIVIDENTPYAVPANNKQAQGQEKQNRGQQKGPKQEDQQEVIYECPPDIVPVEVQAMQAKAQKAPQPRSLNMDKTFQEGINIHSLPVLSEEEIAAADAEEAKAVKNKKTHIRYDKQRVGIVRSVGDVPLSAAQCSVQKAQQALGDDEEGEKKIWTMAIRSSEALGIRLHFSNFDVAEGTVIVYAWDENDTLIARGPYTGKGPQGSGDFWTAFLPGEIVYIELTGIDEPMFEIADFLHFDKPLAGSAAGSGTQALACQKDVMCYSSSVDSYARDATGQMNFVEGGSGWVCTGTILNDFDGDTAMPYFLTAYHCISTQTVVNTLEVVWLYQRSSCGGTLPSYSSLPRSNGGKLLGLRNASDMSFMRLNGGVPGGTMAGWSTGHPSTAYGVHHPGGSWKRVTFLSSVGFCPGCEFCGGGSNFDHYNMTNGINEGGSSGSGVFDSASGRLTGQLYGWCCPNVFGCGSSEPICSTVGNFTAFYGDFSASYSTISRWFDIGGTIHVDRTYGGVELGTPTQPYRTVTAAYNLAWNGSRIKIHAGVYPENLTMTKQITLIAVGGTVTIGN